MFDRKRKDVYKKPKVPLTTLTITVSTHQVVKLFAARKEWSMRQTVEYLLQKSLRQEYEAIKAQEPEPEQERMP